ncbi:DMT family transporter [Sinanaerobacter chloroacetimidivorans]|uniref:DMT family transporter n=1 Tax=Sinanaerobacter chloroacetimidivorans TaxID=2818044 RepID=UPI003867B60A
MEKHRTAAGHLAALITILIWGTTFISTKILLIDFTPVEILVTRFVMGYFALLMVYPHRIKTKGIKEEALFLSAGLCGVTLYFLMENIALTYTLASNVGVIVSVSPLFTAILAHFLLEGESMRTSFIIGFIIAITGVILIVLNGSYILKLNPIGDLLATLAALVWSVYSILMRKISDLGQNSIGCTRRVFFYGLILMTPCLFFLDFDPEFRQFAELPNLLNLLFLGLGASALCFVSWNWTLGVLGAVKTSLYIYVIPVITIAASALILRETITPVACAGVVLTLAGLYLSQRTPQRTSPDTSQEQPKAVLEEDLDL